MDVVATSDAAAFAEQVKLVIARSPVAANVLATNLEAVLAGHRHYDDALWFVLRERGDVVGAGMHTPPWGLFLTPVSDGTADDAARALVETYLSLGRTTDGVSGTTAEATAFARAWERATGLHSNQSMAQRMYELIELVPPTGVSGRACPAGLDDLPLLLDWVAAFEAEVDPSAPHDDLEPLLRARIERGLYLIWVDGDRPVSTAGLNPPAGGVARVGPVYTPPRERRRGYAAAVTAAATRRGFDLGASRCMLYTDLANPTSNGVYQRLGYTPVADAVRLTFTQP